MPGLGACAAGCTACTAAADDAEVLPAGLVALALGSEAAAVEAGVAAGKGDIALAGGAADTPSAVALAPAGEGLMAGEGEALGEVLGLTPGEETGVLLGEGVGAGEDLRLTPGEAPAVGVGVGLTTGEAVGVDMGVGLTPGEVALPASLAEAKAAAAAAAAAVAVSLLPAGEGLSVGDAAFLGSADAEAFLPVPAGVGDGTVTGDDIAAGDGDPAAGDGDCLAAEVGDLLDAGELFTGDGDVAPAGDGDATGDVAFLEASPAAAGDAPGDAEMAGDALPGDLAVPVAAVGEVPEADDEGEVPGVPGAVAVLAEEDGLKPAAAEEEPGDSRPA